MPDRRKMAEDWFAHGDQDFQAAKALFAEEEFTSTVAMLLQQASEKYLKGYLVYQGWKLRKTHDLRRLTAEAISYDPRFEQFRDFARKTTAYYLETVIPLALPLTSREKRLRKPSIRPNI
ncbi:MAG: HEPN domain-containing protein [Chloroflexi bacterium]|nr:HEPN domain-containing protein [Chloroflexota bacterium]